MKRCVYLVSLAGLLVLPLQGSAVAPAFDLGIGSTVYNLDPPNGSTYANLTTSLSSRGLNQNFEEHWFTRDWLTHFPTGPVYLNGSCTSGGQYDALSSYQAVLNAGQRLVIVWWIFGNPSGGDYPCDLTWRTNAENGIQDCLVPMIQALTPGPGLGNQVWVVLQPEYNQNPNSNSNAACSDGSPAYADPSWNTHINNMMTFLHGATYASGLSVKTGPAVGDWAWDVSTYQIAPSLNTCMPNADFIGFQDIYRQNSDQPTPGDTNYGNPALDQMDHAVSLARYLNLEFGKPVLWAYQSVSGANYGNAGVQATMQNIFARRAQLEAQNVQMFGPFWLFPNSSYPTESIIDGSNNELPVFSTYKTLSNQVIGGTNSTQSLGFVTPDTGQEFSGGSMNVQWISRGWPQSASSVNLSYSINGGATWTSIATGLACSDAAVASYAWDTCPLGPQPVVQLQLTCPATGASVVSGTFSLEQAGAVSNAEMTFDTGSAMNWVPSSGGNVSSVAYSTLKPFNGAGSLQVNATFLSGQNAYIENDTPNVNLTGSPVMSALVYVPFALDPCTIPGADVVSAQLALSDGAGFHQQSTPVWLHQGWNSVVYNITGASVGTAVTYMKMSFYSKWGAAGNPPIYVDEICVGNTLAFGAPACASATPTFTPALGTPTPSFTPASGTHTPTPSATPTPTPSPLCTPLIGFDDGTLQGMATSSAAVTSMAVNAAKPHDGADSLQVGLALTATNNVAIIGTSQGLPLNLTGQTVSYWIWVPAGMSQPTSPTGATLFVQTGAGFVWNESSWTNLTSNAWNQITFSMAAVPNANDVVGMGVKVSLGTGSPSWSGNVYVDSLGPLNFCPAATFTPTSSPSVTASATPSRSATASPSQSVSPSASPSRTPTPTLTAQSTATATPTASPTRTPSPGPSASPSSTASPSPTTQVSDTPSETLTPYAGTPTDTAVVSATPSFSPSATASPTPSSSGTSSPAPTASPTPTLTDSATASPSASPSPVPPTGTPSGTPVPGTPTTAPTSTAVPTATNAPTATTVPTATTPPTSTAVPTNTPVPTATVPGTAVPTNTPVSGATATPDNTPASTPLPSLVPGGGSGVVIKAAPSYNPQTGGRLVISVNLNGFASGMELRVFNRSYILVEDTQVPGSFYEGWNQAVFPLPPVDNGIIFCQLRTPGSPAWSAPLRIVILR